MKTYEEFRDDVMEWDFQAPISYAKIEELAAKEYAKQWIEYAYRRQFCNIKEIKNEIDAHQKP